MKTKKLNGYEYSDKKPKAGDVLICIQRNNFNYKHLSVASKTLADMGVIDTVNWKVVENMEERKQIIVDAVIENLKDDMSGGDSVVRDLMNRSGDYTALDELLKFIPMHTLVESLPEEEWENYPEHKFKIV